MEYDPTRMCELLVGLGDVEVLSVDDEGGGPVAGACALSGGETGLWGLRGSLWVRR